MDDTKDLDEKIDSFKKHLNKIKEREGYVVMPDGGFVEKLDGYKSALPDGCVVAKQILSKLPSPERISPNGQPFVKGPTGEKGPTIQPHHTTGPTGQYGYDIKENIKNDLNKQEVPDTLTGKYRAVKSKPEKDFKNFKAHSVIEDIYKNSRNLSRKEHGKIINFAEFSFEEKSFLLYKICCGNITIGLFIIDSLYKGNLDSFIQDYNEYKVSEDDFAHYIDNHVVICNLQDDNPIFAIEVATGKTSCIGYSLKNEYLRSDSYHIKDIIDLFKSKLEAQKHTILVQPKKEQPITVSNEQSTFINNTINGFTKINLNEEYYTHSTFAIRVPPEPAPNKVIPFSKMIGNDLNKAAYRVASNQLTKLANKLIIKTLLSKIDGETSDKISHLLDSEYGSAITSAVIGMILTYTPSLSNNTKAQILAEEFRVNALSVFGNEVVTEITQMILPEMKKYLNHLPQKTRVEAEKEETSVEEDSTDVSSDNQLSL